MNKRALNFFCCCVLCICTRVHAQRDSIPLHSKTYQRIVGTVEWPMEKIRGFALGDSMATILDFEKAILEVQGNDFLYYRVLCDSTLSAEIAYIFNEEGLLISIGIEFFESCKHTMPGNLSDEFLMNLSVYYKNCTKNETGSFECESETGMHMDYQKQKNEMCVIHTQIEFY